MGEEVRIDIVSDGSAARAEVDKAAAAVRSAGNAGTDASAGLGAAAAGFKGLVGAMQRASTLFGVTGVVGALFGLVAMGRQIYGVYKRLTEVNREFAAEARRAADAAREFGFTAAGLDAVRAAAEKAGVPAGELNEKLKEYKDHAITFDDLAAAVGHSADELKRLQDQAERQGAGRSYLADVAARDETREKTAKERKAEEEGLRALFRDVYGGFSGFSAGQKKGSQTDSRAALDSLLDSVGGDPMAAAQKLWPRERDTGDLAAVADSPIMREGVERHAARAASRAAAEEDREFWIRAEQDARDSADRIAGELEVRERLDAEEKAAADKRAAWRLAAHTAEMAALDRESSARADKADKIRDLDRDTADKISKITVEAPRAASAAGAIGGITGGVMPNIQRLADQRAAEAAAIQREHTRLLADINAKLEE